MVKQKASFLPIARSALLSWFVAVISFIVPQTARILPHHLTAKILFNQSISALPATLSTQPCFNTSLIKTTVGYSVLLPKRIITLYTTITLNNLPTSDTRLALTINNSDTSRICQIHQKFSNLTGQTIAQVCQGFSSTMHISLEMEFGWVE